MSFRIFVTLIILLNLISCSKNKKVEYDDLKKLDDPIKIYKEGLEAFNINDFFYASEKFNEAELIFDSPKSAAKSAIMSAYSLYAINLYEQAEENLNRYLKNYPGDHNVVYAHYLLAIIHFEQIGDEEHDLKPLTSTREKIDFFLITTVENTVEKNDEYCSCHTSNNHYWKSYFQPFCSSNRAWATLAYRNCHDVGTRSNWCSVTAKSCTHS